MKLNLILLAGSAFVLATPALAQNNAAGTVAPIASTAEAKALIGAPLLVPSASSTVGEPEGDTGPLFVISGNNVKPAGEWSADDAKACDAAGGVEIEISAGRTACIRL